MSEKNQFTILRDALFKPLQRVAGALEKKQTMPILSNILVSVKNQLLSLTATDLEIEMVARVALAAPTDPLVTTIPGKKLIDICKALPEDALMGFTLADNKVVVRANRSRYTLACLPSENFPRVEESATDVELSLPQGIFRQLLEMVSFAMAHQDVRYYLNGVLMVFDSQSVRMVATDGHRLATMALPLRSQLMQPLSVIVPRKAVFEMQRLFADGEEEIGVVVGKNHLRALTPQSSFITKLIEGKFPDYHRVLPEKGAGYAFSIQRETLRQALVRVSALFSDKYRGVGLQLKKDLLRIVAITQDKDEVEDELEIVYAGEAMEIGVNASYLIEYLNIIQTELVQITVVSPQHAVLFGSEMGHTYVVMPMRL